MAPRLMSIALRLAAGGWHVFPLRCRDKRPLPNFTRWEERATRDPDRIYLWWREMPYNIGVATGPSKLLVVDCDTERGASSPSSSPHLGYYSKVRTEPSARRPAVDVATPPERR